MQHTILKKQTSPLQFKTLHFLLQTVSQLFYKLETMAMLRIFTHPQRMPACFKTCQMFYLLPFLRKDFKKNLELVIIFANVSFDFVVSIMIFYFVLIRLQINMYLEYIENKDNRK